MLEQMPDLASPTKFHLWLTQHIAEGTAPKAILKELERCQSDMSLCRQMIVAYQGHLVSEREALIEKCLSAEDVRIEAYAQALNSYMRIAERSTQQHYDAPAFHLRPMLQAALTNLLAVSKDPFTREVECAIRMALGAAYLLQGKNSEAEQQASSSYYWADRLGIAFAVARAKTLLVSVNLASGQVTDTLAMTRATHDDPNQTVTSRLYLECLEAGLLVQLGQRESVLHDLEQRLAASPDPTRNNAVQLQRQKLVLGLGGLDGDIIKTVPETSAETWLAKSMRCLVRACSLPRTSQTLQERNNLLDQAISLWQEEDQLKYSWAKNMGRWIVGKSYMLKGRPLEVVTLLSGLNVDNRQWFDIRLLKLGLELEIALHLDYPDIAVKPLEGKLREVFVEARQVPFASPEGLAERLIHWHPLAAAYGALMPEPIYELHPITSAVLQLGSKNRVYEQIIPPTYATELALRSLDLDLRPQPSFVQSDPGGGRYKKSMLRVKYGEVDFWRPAISAANLVYGLVKAGHVERARAVYNEFGVAPKSDATYIMLPLIQHIDNCINQLIDGTLIPSTYSTAVTESL
jgi:hypothetical protein